MPSRLHEIHESKIQIQIQIYFAICPHTRWLFSFARHVQGGLLNRPIHVSCPLSIRSSCIHTALARSLTTTSQSAHDTQCTQHTHTPSTPGQYVSLEFPTKMPQNFLLFHASNLSVLNYHIFLLMYPGSSIGGGRRAGPPGAAERCRDSRSVPPSPPPPSLLPLPQHDTARCLKNVLISSAVIIYVNTNYSANTVYCNVI